MEKVYKGIIKYLKLDNRTPIFGVLCLLVLVITVHSYLSAHRVDNIMHTFQVPVKSTSVVKNDSVRKNDSTKIKHGDKKQIVLVYSVSGVKNPGVDYLVLMDSVEFYHDGAKLFCDSAHFNEISNTFDAFSNVRMEQGDSLFLYGNYMQYDGNTKMAIVREDVRMENGSSTLFTDSLNYDRTRNIGYYFDGGMLVDANEDGENVLTSFWGQYEPGIKLATFQDSVKLENPKFTLYSDLLKYSTESKIAFITTPSRIVSDSGLIYTSRGQYNTTTENAILLDRSLVLNKEGYRTMTGDSMIYNRTTGVGETFGNMSLQDTLKKVILRGNYGYFEDKTEYALATDSAYCIEYSQGDSLFLSADTLKMQKDSIYRDILAYHNVRFYRSDLQGVCDSMQYNTRDSVLHLYRDPILWNNKNQLTGDTIDVFMNDSTIDHVYVKRYSFSIEQVDSIRFNQMQGRSMKAFFEDKKLRQVFVEGDAKSIFYPREDSKKKDVEGPIIGLNFLESTFFKIFFKDGKLETLTAWPQPKGSTTPLEMIMPQQTKLNGFYWYDYVRPVNKDDIFRRVKIKTEDKRPVQSSSFDKYKDIEFTD